MIKNEKLHSIEEWLTGKVKADESLFHEEDWAKIIQEQEAIFEKAVENKYRELVANFEERQESSLDVTQMLQDEFDDIKEILYGKSELRKSKKLGNGYITMVHDEHLTNMRDLFHLMVDGGRPKLNFIEFPDINKCISLHQELYDIVEVKAVHQYYLFLQEKLKGPSSMPFIERMSTKQQILTIYYLEKYNIIDLEQLHEDKTRQSKVLYALLNRDESNIYKGLREVHSVNKNNKYFTAENLDVLFEVFNDAGIDIIAKEIKNELKKIKEKKI